MSQSQISRTLRDETAVARIASILSQERFDSRSALGRRICEEFSFADARGRPQLAGCMKALGALAERVPDIVLPPPKASAVERRPRLLSTDVPEPEGVPAHPTRIRDLGIAAVADAADRALWNTLIAREHPHGMTTFAGCQVRYLVGSAHGWLGAVGFAAAALRAAARDRWIGWDDAGRRGHLQRVVCLSRFLIRPSVRCPHLASHVLGRILRRLPGDFEERYGFRPYLVESFADEGYNGTCLRAANFLCVGRTAGRGRQDREKRRAETVKAVFVYELERSWRTKLGVAPVDHAPSLEPGEGLNAQDWAQNEFGGAPLGDRRLSARLVRSAGLLAAYPGQKINAAPDADNTAVNAFYRLIEAPAESEITPGNILAPHRERSIGRMRGQRTVLAIQDGTDLNFSRRPGCDGLQLIGRNQTTATSLGLHMHATLAVTATGLPLGVLALGFDPVKTLSKQEEKRRKTQRWFEAFNGTADAAREIGGKTRVLCVCDREADMFELFDVQRRRPRVELLVRAKYDRVLGKGKPKLFATMSGGTPDGLIDVEIEGLTARPKSSRKKGPPRAREAPGRLRAAVPPRHAAGDARRRGRRPGCCARGSHQGDSAAQRRGTRAVVPADHGQGQNRTRSCGSRRFLSSKVAHRGFLPGPEIRLPCRVPAVPHRRQAAAGDRDQRRHRLAHHGDDAARSPSSRLRPAADVRRPGARLPARLRP